MNALQGTLTAILLTFSLSVAQKEYAATILFLSISAEIYGGRGVEIAVLPVPGYDNYFSKNFILQVKLMGFILFRIDGVAR